MKLKKILLPVCLCLPALALIAQQKDTAPQKVLFSWQKTLQTVQPLDVMAVANARGNAMQVSDGKGKPYFLSPLQPVTTFRVGGALGKHRILLYDKQGRAVDSLFILVDAKTVIEDGGDWKALFDVLYKGMHVYSPDGEEKAMEWKGQKMHFLVPWVLDNYHTQKGMQYFKPYGINLVNAMRSVQKKDGMIWSFISNENADYFKTAYDKYGFFLQSGDCFFARQPVENHVEYTYVNTIYQCWKASGDDAWMRENLASASAALNYCMNDSLRWSAKYQLLKRALTIDSWDFQVEDEYTPHLGTGNPMLVVYGKTKFGIFYGDNTGYMQACHQLGEMYEQAGMKEPAAMFRQRSIDIQQRMNALCWNGHFFTHFIDEDSTVKRKLGVDMNTQISQSNTYSINRGISHEQNVAIIKTYLSLKEHLPTGAPAEWYTIYPPFQRGFEPHNEIWQYMNGGVAGHAAGELALGAFENGYENYGVDILQRLLVLGNKYGEGKRIWFAYTGSFPSPPAARYKTIDLSAVANANYANDLPGMPYGDQQYGGIPFHITDPASNHGQSVLAVSSQKNYAQKLVVPVNDTAQTVYLLHTGMGHPIENIYASITFQYADGSQKTQYIMKGKHLSNWWFPQLQNDHTGVAWSGPNKQSAKVGNWWTAIKNPEAQKKIARLVIQPSLTDAVYIIFGITLSNQLHYVKPKPESFGGPDNWAAATGMAALIQGLAGVKDKATAFTQPLVSPRWSATATDSVKVITRYAASEGYVAYTYRHDIAAKNITLQITGNSNTMAMHLQIPAGVVVRSIQCEGKPLTFTSSVMEQTTYADFSIEAPGVKTIVISYDPK